MRHLRFLILALASSGVLAPPATANTPAQRQCDNQWSKCLGNADKCMDPLRCQNRCGAKYSACLDATSTHNSGGRSGKGTFPNTGRTGGTPPTRLPTNPANGGVKATGHLPTGVMIYRKK
jgi:hypothetical protein